MTIQAVAIYFGFVSFVLALVLIPFLIRWGHRRRWVDRPDPRKKHEGEKPFVGGLALFLVFSVVIWTHVIAGFVLRHTTGYQAIIPKPLHEYFQELPSSVGDLVSVYVAALVVFAVGLWDDVRGLSVRLRLLVQFLCASAVVLLAIRPEIRFVPGTLDLSGKTGEEVQAIIQTVPPLSSWLVWPVSVFWIVLLINSMNFLDGADGLAGGVGAIGSFLTALVLFRGDQPQAALLLVIFGAGLVAFLRYNFYPARVFLGNSGSNLLGMLLALGVLMSVSIKNARSPLYPILAPMMLMAIPLFDTLSVVYIRIRQGRSIFKGDRYHLVHRLQKVGFTVPQAVLFIYLLALLFGIDALVLPLQSPFETSATLIQFISAVLVVIILERVAWNLERKRRVERILNGRTTDNSDETMEIEEVTPRQE